MPDPLHSRRSFLVLPVASLTSVALSRASEPGADIPDRFVIQKFKVAKGGEPLLVPVQVRGKEWLFLVDTGCTNTVFDLSLDLGPPRMSATCRTPLGNTRAWFYDTPPASVAGTPLDASALRRPISRVVGCDLASVRDASEAPIAGILGMDYLGQHILHLDFDRGVLVLLKSVPPMDRSVSIFWEFGVEPEVEVEIGEGRPRRFRIDTGQMPPDIGSIETAVLGRLVTRGIFKRIGSAPVLVLGAAGGQEVGWYRGTGLRIGDYLIDGPQFLECAGKSQLGLGFLSRFVTTLDFPGRRLFLSEGKAFGRAGREDS